MEKIQILKTDLLDVVEPATIISNLYNSENLGNYITEWHIPNSKMENKNSETKKTVNYQKDLENSYKYDYENSY